MNRSVLCLCIVLSLLLSGHCVSLETSKRVQVKWDFLLLAQFWPPTSCYVFFGRGNCTGIPSEVKGWTLHGLWPSVYGAEHPQPEYCNSSAHFNYDKIKSLGSKLDVQWPYYGTNAPKTFLWDHEWGKHGTCAHDLPLLSGEFNYFNTTLLLHTHLDVLKALEKKGITPSNTILYSVHDFYTALKSVYEVIPGITCLHHEEKYYIDQIYLCFTKSFKLQDCPDSVEDKIWNPMRKIKDNEPVPQCPPHSKKRLHFEPIDQPAEEKNPLAMYFESELKEIIRSFD